MSVAHLRLMKFINSRVCVKCLIKYSAKQTNSYSDYPRGKGRLRNLRYTLLTSSGAASHFPQNNQMKAIMQDRAAVKFISGRQTI